jgi:hypothetical protein
MQHPLTNTIFFLSVIDTSQKTNGRGATLRALEPLSVSPPPQRMDDRLLVTNSAADVKVCSRALPRIVPASLMTARLTYTPRDTLSCNCVLCIDDVAESAPLTVGTNEQTGVAFGGRGVGRVARIPTATGGRCIAGHDVLISCVLGALRVIRVACNCDVVSPPTLCLCEGFSFSHLTGTNRPRLRMG